MQRYAAGDWFAIPLRFGLCAVGRAIAVDGRGAILGYFFGRFYERLPSGADLLALEPGDADLIGVCDPHGLHDGEWPLVGPPGFDPRCWSVPIFRSIDAASGALRWTTVDEADLTSAVVFPTEPAETGTRNWGLPMAALAATPMSWAAVEFALWQRFRTFQNGLHRKYIADMQRDLDSIAAV